MIIILYNPSSKGGNFDYVLRLYDAYTCRPEVQKVILVLPKNAKVPFPAFVKKILLSDQPRFSPGFLSKVFFIYRTFLNPLILFFFIRKHRGHVILNDFDQVSSFFWAPLYRFLKPKIVFSIYLHDPDRDQYFRNLWLSRATMRSVMSVMDVGFYHEILPDKLYYKSIPHTTYISVPHGLYDLKVSESIDSRLRQTLEKFRGPGSKLIGALGNIRPEKNYILILKALKKVDGINLLIAGLPANTSVKIKELQQIIENEGLKDRVFFLPKYLDEQELRTIAAVCDAFILYYSNRFKSQSGILNLLAPFQKTLLVSSNDSPLSLLVDRFKLGLMAKADCENELILMLQDFAKNNNPNSDWQGYFVYASWRNHIDIAIDALNKLK